MHLPKGVQTSRQHTTSNRRTRAFNKRISTQFSPLESRGSLSLSLAEVSALVETSSASPVSWSRSPTHSFRNLRVQVEERTPVRSVLTIQARVFVRLYEMHPLERREDLFVLVVVKDVESLSERAREDRWVLWDDGEARS